MAEEVIIDECTTQVNYPHNSGHVPENVNVTGTMTCGPVPVSASYLDIYLFYNGSMFAYGQNYQYGTLFNSVNAATPCQAGVYYAELDYYIYFGATWTPPTANGTLTSPALPIAC